MARALLGAVILAMTAVPLSFRSGLRQRISDFEGSGRSNDGDQLPLCVAALAFSDACTTAAICQIEIHLRKLPNLLHPPLR